MSSVDSTHEPVQLIDKSTRKHTKSLKKQLYAKSAAAFRWVHIYVSMLSFAALMFFAFTGITLNHPTWLGGSEQNVADFQGEIAEEVKEALSPERIEEDKVDELVVAEWLRAEHSLKGKVTEFRTDEYECMVVFKGPGYAADAFIDHQAGTYMVTETRSSLMAVMNDLHKGRDSGAGWAWFIDVSAAVMMLMSVSGFGLLFYLRRRRVSGVLVALVGTVAIVVVWALCVP